MKKSKSFFCLFFFKVKSVVISRAERGGGDQEVVIRW